MIWRSYLNDRLIADHQSGFVIIKPRIMARPIPLSCPNCDCLFRTSDDEAHYMQFSCCDFCANKWAYKNQERWKSGWRPSTDEIKAELVKQYVPITKLIIE